MKLVLHDYYFFYSLKIFFYPMSHKYSSICFPSKAFKILALSSDAFPSQIKFARCEEGVKVLFYFYIYSHSYSNAICLACFSSDAPWIFVSNISAVYVWVYFWTLPSVPFNYSRLFQNDIVLVFDTSVNRIDF